MMDHDDFNLFGWSEAVMFKVRLAIFVVVAIAIASLVIWYGEWRADTVRTTLTAQHEAAVGRLRVEAATKLAEATRENLRLERELNTAHTRIEEESLAHRETSAHYERMLAAAAAAGRLRDPFAASGCGGDAAAGASAAAAGAGAPGGAEAGRALSAGFTRVLLELFADADRINDAYAACRADALSLRPAVQLSPSP